MGHPYSDLLMNHFMHPRHAGVLPDASGSAELKNNTCGDRTRIYVRIEHDTLRAATFLAAGCGPGIACADYLLDQVIAHSVDEALAISVHDVTRALRLPKQKLHAAELAVATLQAAIDDHRARAPRTTREA